MSIFFTKYATATVSSGDDIGIPLAKAGSADFSVGADWVPSAGDVKISLNGGAQANIASLPSFSNGEWKFILSAAETTAKRISIAIVDAAPKAVDDDFIIVHTYGNAAAKFAFDFSSATVTVGTVAASATNFKKATALPGFTFVMTDSTNHNPNGTFTVLAQRSLDGAAFANCPNPVSAIANGAYKIDLATSDMNANIVTLRFSAIGGDDLFLTLITQP